MFAGGITQSAIGVIPDSPTSAVLLFTSKQLGNGQYTVSVTDAKSSE